MKKISTLIDLRSLIGNIMEDQTDLLSPIKNMDDNLDIFKVYDRTIELASSYLEVEVALNYVPFSMKFHLVSHVINKIYGEAGIDAFLEKILSVPFDTDSMLLTAIKNDYRVCADLANLGCLLENYEWTYLLLNHMYETIDNIPTTCYQIVISSLAFLLESLNKIIQKKLYNDDRCIMNHELIKFIISFMEVDITKKEATIVYQRLLLEYPEILRVYDQAVTTLNRLKARKLIMI
ncbi:MAG: hypothetical protein PHD15_05750 [Clostridia bacterium]|nr:hypothetical protein [Clostridia bacterium]MDD4387236.1 hypothetical protein [Clostridia bacterium]